MRGIGAWKISFDFVCCQEKQEEEELPRKRGCEKLHNLGRVQNNWKAGKVEVEEALIRQGERCEAKWRCSTISLRKQSELLSAICHATHLSLTISLSFCLPVCLQSILSISISLTARSMNKIKLTFAKLVRACALFIFNAMTIRSPGGATYGYRQQQQQLQLQQPFPFAVLLAICLLLKNDLSLYIELTHTNTHRQAHRYTRKIS